MSNRAHRGRCFRSNRRTAQRKTRQGVEYSAHQIRWKVPQAIAGFLAGATNQLRAGFAQMASTIVRYNAWRDKTGKGPAVVAEGS